MKKYILLSAFCVAIVSCTMLEPTSLDDVTLQLTRIKANYDSQGTKVELQEGGHLYWNPGDKISLFYHGEDKDNGGYELSTDINMSSATADFTGQAKGCDGYQMYSIYPFSTDNKLEDNILHINIPSEQTAVEGGFDKNTFYCIAESNDGNMSFKNLMGGIKLSLASDDIKKITVQRNNARSICGWMSVTLDSSTGDPTTTSDTDGENCLTITPSEDDFFKKNTSYYIPLVPTEFENGITITYYKESTYAKFSTFKDIVIKRSVFSNIGCKDDGLEYKPIPVVNSYGMINCSIRNDSVTSNDYSSITEINFYVNSPEPSSTYSEGYDSPERVVREELVGTTLNFYTSGEYFLLKPWSVQFFAGLSSLKSLDLTNVRFCQCENMYGMFQDDVSLTSVKFGKVETENVTDMRCLFFGCTSLESVDLAGFDFDRCESIAGFFQDCTSLKYASLSGLDLRNISSLGCLFYGCQNLTDIDFSGIDTKNVTDMGGMFAGCSSLKHLDISCFNTSKVTDMAYMFSNCKSLESIDLSSFNTSSLKDACGMFNNCCSLKNLDIHNFDTSNVTKMWAMFCKCYMMESITLGAFKTDSIDSYSDEMDQLFSYMGAGSMSCKVICDAEALERLYAMGYLYNIYDPESTHDATQSTKKYLDWYKTGETTPTYSKPSFDGLYESIDYSKDGMVKTLQSASIGNGIDIVIMGDAFSDRLIDDGTYDSAMSKIMESIFSVEPLTTYRDYFNVYEVVAVSKHEDLSGITKFLSVVNGSQISGAYDLDDIYAQKAISNSRLKEAVVIICVNKDANCGETYYMVGSSQISGDYGSGESILYITRNQNDEEFKNTIHHEFGHAFAKLADEYWYDDNSTFDGSGYSEMAEKGYYKNIDLTSDSSEIKWNRFISDSRYANESIGAYEGGFVYGKGVWRPTENSIMRYNTGIYNAPSREAFYYRINKLAYGLSWQYDYETFVAQDLKNIPTTSSVQSSFAKTKIMDYESHDLPPKFILINR